ncbi:MAG: hypothetical protein QNJ97_19600 [Myxococcota bacterium]|nr:hypothetical protein [Myxococcota bacterium]
MHKNYFELIVLLIGSVVSFGNWGCDQHGAPEHSTEGGPDTSVFELEGHIIVPSPGDAMNIDVVLMCNMWSCEMQEWGEQKLTEFRAEKEESIPCDFGTPAGEYQGYGTAMAMGFYTELVRCENGQVILDLDEISAIDRTHAIAGTVILTQDGYPDTYGSFYEIEVSGPEGVHFVVSTDNQGRFGLMDLPLGSYELTVIWTAPWAPNDEFIEFIFELENTVGLDYSDLIFRDPLQLD